MTERGNNVFRKFLVWRHRHISEKNFILILSILIGILAAIAAVSLKTLVHHIELFVRDITAREYLNWFFLALPFTGITITVIYIKYFVKDDISHGITKILSAISKNKAIIKLHNTYTSVISCAITTGFGGSVGMEAPIVYTGSAIGSNLGTACHLSFKKTTLLVGCGASAAIAAIFKAPIAGLIFALEVLMLDLTLSSIIPLLISTVTAAIFSAFFLGSQVEFHFSIKDPFNYNNIPFYIILGVVCGFVSLYFTKVNFFVENRFRKFGHKYQRILLGGLLLGILIFFFPPLFGEGYIALKALLQDESELLLNNTVFLEFGTLNWVLIIFLALVLLFKVFATAITTGSGGVGGVFAPSLFVGGLSGFIFARLLNMTSWVKVSETNFALVGMAGLIAGVIHAPLTAIFLIAEITGGYELFIPLIITASIAYLTIMYFEPHSLYTKRLAQKGELITHHKDKAVLTLLKVENCIEKNFMAVNADDTLGALVRIIATSKRNIFPVIDKDKNFLGLIPLDDVREIMFQKEKYDSVFVKELMIQPPEIISLNDSMDTVMNKLKKTGLWNLPVVENGKYLGFISRANIFNIYRNLLIEVSDV
ncbi:MAG: chloride channel protein [Bacteroidales bacterium]|nr:chloride channel protein [Bacteroidales bacterium]